jgi:hypothetical protein
MKLISSLHRIKIVVYHLLSLLTITIHGTEQQLKWMAQLLQLTQRIKKCDSFSFFR